MEKCECECDIRRESELMNKKILQHPLTLTKTTTKKMTVAATDQRNTRRIAHEEPSQFSPRLSSKYSKSYSDHHTRREEDSYSQDSNSEDKDKHGDEAANNYASNSYDDDDDCGGDDNNDDDDGTRSKEQNNENKDESGANDDGNDENCDETNHEGSNSVDGEEEFSSHNGECAKSCPSADETSVGSDDTVESLTEELNVSCRLNSQYSLDEDRGKSSAENNDGSLASSNSTNSSNDTSCENSHTRNDKKKAKDLRKTNSFEVGSKAERSVERDGEVASQGARPKIVPQNPELFVALETHYQNGKIPSLETTGINQNFLARHSTHPSLLQSSFTESYDLCTSNKYSNDWTQTSITSNSSSSTLWNLPRSSASERKNGTQTASPSLGVSLLAPAVRYPAVTTPSSTISFSTTTSQFSSSTMSGGVAPITSTYDMLGSYGRERVGDFNRWRLSYRNNQANSGLTSPKIVHPKRREDSLRNHDLFNNQQEGSLASVSLRDPSLVSLEQQVAEIDSLLKEREERTKRQREAAQRQREIREKRQREARQRKERAKREMREREERERKERKEREIRERQERETRERELREMREREDREMREREEIENRERMERELEDIYKDRSFHCDVCNVCLDKRLEGKHKCRPNSGHDECCICLEDAFSGCQILPCSHKVHRECAIAMIQNGVILRQTTEKRRDGIQWTLMTRLEDLDFADDVALLSHNHQGMQSKLTRMAKISAKAGLRISKPKTNGMRINTSNADRLELGGEDIEEVEDFVYLSSNISKDGGSDRDIQVRIGKARTAFTTLRPLWNSKTISRKTKTTDI
ncbi:Halomucin [Stylophora pistillata]|uniref:Halomucin n=1 Tax=Stylophora pistillata TaxID=50429 RepID=A0A2B4S9F3_STYPI|nr:Halomucin [Stylophora pistillata]